MRVGDENEDTVEMWKESGGRIPLRHHKQIKRWKEVD
jgi:hypothetical protein